MANAPAPEPEAPAPDSSDDGLIPSIPSDDSETFSPFNISETSSNQMQCVSRGLRLEPEVLRGQPRRHERERAPHHQVTDGLLRVLHSHAQLGRHLGQHSSYNVRISDSYARLETSHHVHSWT